jgi:hypothetical protein
MIWIDAKKELPYKAIPVLCFNKTAFFVGIYARPNEIECVDSSEDSMLLDEGWYELEEQVDSSFDEFYCKREVTHWMLLPNKP